MSKTENLSLELCRQLLCSSGFDGKDFFIKSYQKKNEANVLEVSNKNYDVIFSLASKEKKDGSFDDTFFHFEMEGCVTYVENVIIKNYHCPKRGELDQKQLLSVFKNLAHHHSKCIAENDKQIKNEQSNEFLTEVNQKILENLYEMIPSVENKTIDLNVLKKGIDQLFDNSKEDLHSENQRVYVKGGIFRRKIVFKDDDQSVGCCLVNLRKGRLVSAVYDMLSLLYLLTDQKQRQKHFHEITDHYHQILSDLNVDLPLVVYEKEIKTVIPYVKLDLLSFYLKQLNEEKENNTKHNVGENLKVIYELISELYEHVVSPKITREECYKIVRDAMGTNYESLNYELTDQEGLLGLIGQYSKLKITITQKNKDKVFRLFAKFVPSKMAQFSVVFLREEFFYVTFMSELKRLGLEDITDFLPKCYFVRSADVIIFEDLSYLNYKPANCDESFSYQMLQLAVKQLAKMHACSLLYEEISAEKSGKESRLHDKFAEYVEDILYIKDNKFIEAINNCGINTVIGYVFDQFVDVPKEISLECFKDRARKLFDLMIMKFEISKKYRNVICHGDVWGGNILFKFDDTQVSDCLFIDYQLIRYCPPAHDLLAFIYINTDKATRTKYMSTLIDQYYDELSSIFKKYNVDLNSVYSYDHYIECCDYMKSHAICLAALTYPCSLDREKVQNILVDTEKKMHFMLVDKIDILQELMKDDRVRARYREIVEDLYDICLETDLS